MNRAPAAVELAAPFMRFQSYFVKSKATQSLSDLLHWTIVCDLFMFAAVHSIDVTCDERPSGYTIGDDD